MRAPLRPVQTWEPALNWDPPSRASASSENPAAFRPFHLVQESTGLPPGGVPIHPPAPPMEPDLQCMVFGGYKTASGAVDSGIRQFKDTVGGNYAGLVAPEHRATHSRNERGEFEKLPMPAPGKGPAEYAQAFRPNPNGQKPGPGNPVIPFEYRNDGEAIHTTLPPGTFSPDATSMHHSHPPSEFAPSGGKEVHVPSIGDAGAARFVLETRGKFHEAAVSGTTGNLNEQQLEIWNRLSPEEKMGYREPPAPMKFILQAPALPRTPYPKSAADFHENPNYVFTSGGRYHLLVPKSDPAMDTPPDSPAGQPPSFRYPPEGNTNWPPHPPMNCGPSYPAGPDFGDVHWLPDGPIQPLPEEFGRGGTPGA